MKEEKEDQDKQEMTKLIPEPLNFEIKLVQQEDVVDKLEARRANFPVFPI